MCLAGLLNLTKLSGHVGTKIFVLVPVFSVFLWHNFSLQPEQNPFLEETEIPEINSFALRVRQAHIQGCHQPCQAFLPQAGVQASFSTRFSLEWAAEALSILSTCKASSWHLCFHPGTQTGGCRGRRRTPQIWLPGASGLSRAQSWNPQIPQFMSRGSQSFIKN